MEPHDGIEPTPSVWKTEVLPLYECDIGWEGRGRTYTTEFQRLVTIPIRLLPNGDRGGIRTRECMRERHMS